MATDVAQRNETQSDSSLRLRLLHIEYNPSDALSFRTMLKKAGAELDLVGVASTLKSGLDQSNLVAVDCIISDLNLPDSEGLDVVHKLTQKFPEIPLIVLTSTDGLELGRKAIAAGAQDYLIKENLNGDSLSRVIRFAVERMRLRARHAEVRKRMQQDLRHKERVLQLSRRLHKVRSLNAFLTEFKTNFSQFFDAGLFSLFVFKPSSGWSLGCHNHPYWKGESKGALQLKGIMAESVAQGIPIAYKQMAASPFGAPHAYRYVSDNAITLPLKVDDQLVGVLNLNDNPNENFEDETLNNITNLAEHLSLALFNVLSYEEYQGLAHCDGLTRLYNRWYLHHQLPQEINRSKRYGLSLSAIVCDIDHFKSINDTHGHPVGDEVLMAFSRLILEMIRGSDMAFRIGGEEFLVLLPNTSGKDAMILAERIRIRWSEELFLTPNSQTLRSTASFGVCELSEASDMDAFIAFTDRALYRAKQEGRNRCILG